MWLTMIWHLGLSLPWSWRIGPSYSSERAHVVESLAQQTFPENTLFCGDAGFVGYDFWREIQSRGHHFLVRVGGNVRLLRRLGYVREYEGIVYCWPDAAAKKKHPPLVLRLLHFRDRRGDVYLVTSVLNKKSLTDVQASEIYRRRWGIETNHAHYVQRFSFPQGDESTYTGNQGTIGAGAMVPAVPAVPARLYGREAMSDVTDDRVPPRAQRLRTAAFC